MGFYSVCPGTDEYVLGSPVFRKTTITLENGKQFIIDAGSNNQKNVFIQSAKLNGANYSKNYIRYQDIVNGGTLKLEMSNQPNKLRGLSSGDLPYSVSGLKATVVQ
jgi:putative alpha-1,2-mannosidase